MTRRDHIKADLQLLDSTPESCPLCLDQSLRCQKRMSGIRAWLKRSRWPEPPPPGSSRTKLLELGNPANVPLLEQPAGGCTLVAAVPVDGSTPTAEKAAMAAAFEFIHHQTKTLSQYPKHALGVACLCFRSELVGTARPQAPGFSRHFRRAVLEILQALR